MPRSEARKLRFSPQKTAVIAINFFRVSVWRDTGRGEASIPCQYNPQLFGAMLKTPTQEEYITHQPFQEATHTLSPLTLRALTMKGFDVATQPPWNTLVQPHSGKGCNPGNAASHGISGEKNCPLFAQGRMLQGSTFPAEGSTRKWDLLQKWRRRGDR